MSKSDIFSWFYTNSTNLTAEAILLIMLSGLLIAMLIFATYWFTFRGVTYNQKFNVSNVLVLLITIVIMLMISSNIVISLGMVGALSIVRFRTAIKDPRDTIFIFWSITEGLCIGSQNFKLAFISTIFIAITMLLFYQYQNKYYKYILIIRGNGTLNKIEPNVVLDCLKKYVISSQIKSSNCSQNYEEIIIQLRVKKEFDNNAINELLSINGIDSINCLKESMEE